MKTLTIRLDDKDLELINSIRVTQYDSTTINGTIRKALRFAAQYVDLITELGKIFDRKWVVKEKELIELSRKHGFLQRDFLK